MNTPVKPIDENYTSMNTNNQSFYNSLCEAKEDIDFLISESEQAGEDIAFLMLASDYSTSPVRIGTWLDGRSVYRTAFDVLLKDMDATSYGDILSNSAFSVSANAGSGYSTPIYAFCVYAADRETELNLCPIAELSGTIIDFEIPSGVNIPEDQSDCTDEHYYGYIDFIHRS